MPLQMQLSPLWAGLAVYSSKIINEKNCLLYTYRFDSANYKMILKKNGVHLIYVLEPIAEGSQGILVETLLEGMAEYYSCLLYTSRCV